MLTIAGGVVIGLFGFLAACLLIILAIRALIEWESIMSWLIGIGCTILAISVIIPAMSNIWFWLLLLAVAAVWFVCSLEPVTKRIRKAAYMLLVATEGFCRSK